LSHQDIPPARQPFAALLVGALIALKLSLHLFVLATTEFGIHRDEFLYFSMGEHLRFWRMDFPPLIAVLANLARAIFDQTLATARVLPALEGSLVVLLAALIARELGGGRFAQVLAALCMLGSALFLRASTLFQPVVLDQLWWTVGLYALVRLVRDEHPRWWIAFGAAVGLGLLTKFSILFFAVSAAVAIVVSPTRRWLLTRWPWLAAGLALAIGSPSIVGQIALGFPVAGQMSDLQTTQLTHVTWSLFVTTQPLMVGPVPFLLSILGAAGLLLWKPWRQFAVVGWTCLAAFVLLFVLRGKAYYIGPVYPTLFAAGGVLMERWRPARWMLVLRTVVVAGVVAYAALLLPIGVPLLSKEATASFAVRVGAAEALRTNRGVMDRLPQDYADMLGWEEQAQALARVAAALTPVERDSAVIFASNYGQAGAAEFYGPRYGLPPVVSAAGSFWFFGPGERTGSVLITIGEDSADVAEVYADVRPAGMIVSPWSVEEERAVPLLVARRPRLTLQQLWPSLAGEN
jgi:4-amino-4-deoxy-L-arabinose transferase-like glycosyltransferase